MLTDAELDDLRGDLDDELRDRITVYRIDPDNPETTDPVTYEPIPNWIPVHADLHVDVGLPALVVREPSFLTVVDQGDAPQATRMYSVTAPVAATDIRVEDLIVVVACHDPATVAAALTVKDPQHGSLSISRRFRCQANLTYPRGLPDVEGS